eukprot:CAMPEP_0204349532 /NCGR_PEP_ID=MMETSP0469-20131031/29603_1 /ASSEMBLY_ACC=CAM_ASM_000384 /TAXON_ID=2969 /ORGANISM="Oxyrrhis marina" /LENGTH=128 /DNA_ID=CAMNT_0051335739 /DNA_START=20 /DNA_END=403 /DNA_ORIENTATION=-
MTYAAIGLVLYSGYTLCFERMFLAWDTTLNQWDELILVVYNMGWLYNVFTGIAIILYMRGAAQNFARARMIESVLVAWACSLPLVSCFFSNRWRTSKIFGGEPDHVFKQHNYDADLLLTMLAAVSWCC